MQGSSLSPVLGNVYLHHVLDLWFERDVLPRLAGNATLIRYVDDAVFTFETESDARRVLKALAKRFERFGLELHPEKTRLLPYQRPALGTKGRGPGTFDFLGFTHYWRRAPSGHWTPGARTRKASLRRFVVAVADYCRSHRHEPVKEQHAALTRRITGHFNYFGVNGNVPSLQHVRRACGVVWHKWLNRRSQRAEKSWDAFNDMQREFPLPSARVYVRLWSAP